MRHLSLISVAVVVLALLYSVAAAGELSYVIPLKPDPPIAVDGSGAEWVSVPNSFQLDKRENATYKGILWDGPEDLSATGQMAWRREGLFLYLDITDDHLRQTERGKAMWKGDHVEWYLDFAPDTEPDRSSFAKGQFQISFSPGNFRTTGDALVDIKPEVCSHYPPELDTSTISYVALRTPSGWQMEAMIPFSLLGVSPEANMPVACEVAVSDSDSAEASQETMITIGTQPWRHVRQRLVPMALGNAAGEATVAASVAGIATELMLPAGSAKEVSFQAPEIPAGKAAYIFFRARIVNAKPAGWTRGLKLTLNGKPVEASRLSNRPVRSMRNVGLEATSIAPTGEMNIWYGPDFTAADKSSGYSLMGGVKAHEWEFDITDLLVAGDNALHIQVLTGADTGRDIAMGDLEVRVKAPPPPAPPKQPAPTGPLSTIVPRQDLRTDYTVAQTDAATLVVNVSGERFVIESRFSSPDGKWYTGSSDLYTHSRRIEEKPEHIVVYDTFKNLSRDNVAVMQRHMCDFGDRFEKAWLAGISPSSGDLTASESGNPSSFATTKRAGLGMLPLNDEFQVHVTNSCLNGVLGLSDNDFVLRPGSEYTAEWMILPTARPDFWDFVNGARRARDANFTLKWQFGFLSPGTLVDSWSDEVLTQFLRNKGLDIACASIGYRYKGRSAHGTAFQEIDHSSYIGLRERIKRLCPEVMFSVYFHCFLDVRDGAEEDYYNDRRLRSTGEQGIYSTEYMRIFNPTLDNDFGPAIAKNIDVIIDKIGADSVYWDEIAYSKYKYHYGEPWDGCSADIDPSTLQINRLKSSVSLISLPFQVKLIERIMAHGPLVTNGMPQTRTHAQLKYQAFTETGSISNCLRTLLYSPVALGDHLTERSGTDAYRWMVKALDYGCVYNWYSQRVIPQYPTIASYMFPITPLELHEGYIIGAERILTNRSGMFGWGDGSQHEVHVFNDEGAEVTDFSAPSSTIDGNTYTELRIAEGWSAAIIRR
jgi:hypothetical protein